ncbi:MAG: beta-galactosidase [Ruminiclostridium sp.]
MSSELLKNFFPYGVSYYRPATPVPEYWAMDLKNIADSGFNTIRVSAFWSRIEKADGQYDFSEFDGICAAAAKENLKVLMTLYIVNMPEWMFEQYSDSRMVSAAGHINYSEHHPDAVAGGWPGLCMDCADIMGKVQQFIKEITLHYKGNDTILAFDVIHEPWEEPSQEYYIDSWKNGVFCYCSHSIEKFKGWLLSKYHTLNELNKAWSRSYSNWDQVQPPRTFGNYADWLDWRLFSVESLTNESLVSGQTVKEYDSDRVTVNHGGGVLNAFSSSADTFELANTVDIPGASNYSIKSPQDAGMTCDFLRSASPADGKFWIGETSGGSGPMFSFIGEDIEKFFAFGMPWSTEIQNKHVWKMLSHGAKGMIYWMWRPEVCGCEIAGMGFTDREGGLTPRVANAKRISKIIMENKELFMNSKPPESKVAILYNINTSILEGFAATSKSVQGNAGLFANFKDLRSLSGIAKICMENSVEVDYINDKLIAGGKLSQYKLLILPYSICIGTKAVEKIKEFVKNGGTVIADALCGYFRENGWGAERVPAYGLDEIFGCKVLEYGYSMDYKVLFEKEVNDRIFNSKFVTEKLVVGENSRIIARFEDGNPAAVLNKYGKGNAIYIGAPVFMHSKVKDPGILVSLMDFMLLTAGIEKNVHVNVMGGNLGIEVRILQTENQKLLFVMNHSGTECKADIEIICDKKVELLCDADTGDSKAYSLTENGICMAIKIGALGVQLFKLQLK